MARVSKAWQLRKQWREELHLNIGLAEGEEWFGVFNTAMSVEFTVLGDTINHACGLSDFGRHGVIWATKRLIGKLSPDDRQAIRFGIYRPTADGRDQLVPSTFSRLSNLIDPTTHKHHTFHELATLAITEITEIAAHED